MDSRRSRGSLRHPIIADLIAHAEPVTAVRSFRGTANRRLHLERMRRWPEQLIALGDAVAAFNPIYGQGMSVAAVGAEVLDAMLRRRRPIAGGTPAGFGRRFQRQLARANADARTLATSEDLRMPTTMGARVTPTMHAQHRYVDRVVTAATTNPTAAEAYVRVLSLLDRPTSMFHPRVLAAAVQPRRPNLAGPLPAAVGRTMSEARTGGTLAPVGDRGR